MKVKVLASGSKGNSTLVQINNINLLIDIGINYQYLSSEIEKVNLTPKDIDYVLITHTHNDHIKGLSTLMNKTNVKVFILESMIEELRNKIPLNENIYFYQNPTLIEDIKIELIKISHDVCGVGFIIEHNNSSLVYITDTGYINSKYYETMKNKNMYILESNHDEKMVMEGPYPHILKQRVLSDKGHLSNIATSECLLNIVGDKTKYIILAHISENNNTPDLALETTRQLLEENGIDKNIIIAKQYESLEEIEV